MKELDDGALKRCKLFVRSRGILEVLRMRNKPVHEEKVSKMVCREVVIDNADVSDPSVTTLTDSK